jgi:hypothetical protein
MNRAKIVVARQSRAQHEAMRSEIWFLACHYRRVGLTGAAEHLRRYFHVFSTYAVIE